MWRYCPESFAFRARQWGAHPNRPSRLSWIGDASVCNPSEPHLLSTLFRRPTRRPLTPIGGSALRYHHVCSTSSHPPNHHPARQSQDSNATRPRHSRASRPRTKSRHHDQAHRNRVHDHAHRYIANNDTRASRQRLRTSHRDAFIGAEHKLAMFPCCFRVPMLLTDRTLRDGQTLPRRVGSACATPRLSSAVQCRSTFVHASGGVLSTPMGMREVLVHAIVSGYRRRASGAAGTKHCNRIVRPFSQ